jgi:hypothetical protein
VHSSALIDGLFYVGRLQQPNGIGSVAAHIAIGFTGQRHRRSGVVRVNALRQRMACPICKRCDHNGPHNLPQNVRPRWRVARPVPDKISASDWPLPDDRFTGRRSIVGPSLFTAGADFLQSEYSFAAFPLSFVQPSHPYHTGVESVPRPRQWLIRFAPVCSR